MPRRSPGSYAAPDPLSTLLSALPGGGPVTTIKAVTDLPARLYGGNAQTVEVSGLDYTLHLDIEKLPIAEGGGAANKWTVVWDETNLIYGRVEFTNLPLPAHTHVISDTTGLQVALDGKAPLASPVFIGDPQAPTPAIGDNDSSIATTAFIRNYLASTEPPSDGNEYVRVNGVWRLNSQTFTPAGVASFDVQVPTNARLAKIVAYFVPGAVTLAHPILTVSVDGTSFLQTSGDYYYAGFIHNTGSVTPTAVTNVSLTAGTSLPLIAGDMTSTTDVASIMMTLQIIRPSTAVNWNMHTVSHAFLTTATAQNTDFIYRGHVLPTRAGSALAFQKLRFGMTGGNTFAAGTSLTIEWIY